MIWNGPSSENHCEVVTDCCFMSAVPPAETVTGSLDACTVVELPDLLSTKVTCSSTRFSSLETFAVKVKGRRCGMVVLAVGRRVMVRRPMRPGRRLRQRARAGEWQRVRVSGEPRQMIVPLPAERDDQTFGLVTVRSRSAFTLHRTCFTPDGQLIVSRETILAEARPKWTTVSLPEPRPTEPQKTSRTCVPLRATRLTRAPQPSRFDRVLRVLTEPVLLGTRSDVAIQVDRPGLVDDD